MSHSVAVHNVVVLQVDAHSHQVLKSLSYCVAGNRGTSVCVFSISASVFLGRTAVTTPVSNQCPIPAGGRQVAAQRQFPGPYPVQLLFGTTV